MERRGLNVRKFLLRSVLPVLRLLPLPLASRLIAGIGRTEYRLLSELRAEFQTAVGRARETLDCRWDVAHVSLELAGNQVLWRTRDLLLDGVAGRRLAPMFEVTGRGYLDEIVARKQGAILLTSHFGAHLLPTHWLAREGYPLRFYMERPRHVSRFLERHFSTGGPIDQAKLFISRKADPAGAASSILRASRALHAGMLLYLAGDVRWTGPHAQPARFLGRDRTFSATWVNLAALTGVPVVPVFCQMQPAGHYHIEFGAPFHVPPDDPRNGRAAPWVQRYLSLLEDQVRLYPSNSNEYFFWPEVEEAG